MISCHCRTALARSYQAVPLEAISKDDLLHTGVDRDENIDWLNVVTQDIRHHAYATSASSKFAFHLFESLCALKSSNDALLYGIGLR